MLLTTLAFAQGMANIMENLDYQIVGILVVMMCLGGLAVILTISGSIAASIQNKAKAKAAAASAAPAPVPAAAPAAAGKPLSQVFRLRAAWGDLQQGDPERSHLPPPPALSLIHI